jgi:ABC-type phosphate/phosphonate transport system substrate-binding protein
MPFCSLPSGRARPRSLLFLLGLAALLAASPGVAPGQKQKLDVLRIGTTGSLVKDNGGKEKASMKNLRNFIKDETGLKNEILRQKDWRELTDQLAKGKLQLGVFQGYEFAWARDKRPALKPLTVAVAVYRYPVAYLVTRRDNPARKFADLKGKRLAIPDTGQAYLNLFAERESQALGKKLNKFFSKITAPENAEAALDAVVDKAADAAAVDQAALEAYKRRQPGRFKRLHEIAKSPPFPPAVVAYHDDALDRSVLQRFRKGMLNAKRTERGETMLNLFGLSGFEDVPGDFERVLAQLRKTYPAEPPARK